MRKGIALLAVFVLLLSGCTAGEQAPKTQQYTASFLTLFDTVTTIVGRSENEAAFTETAQRIHDDLEVYHRLFDIYNSYEGITNLKDINDAAGKEPLVVDARTVDFLLDCKQYHEITGGKVNVAMGSVLHLWHVARNGGIDDPANAVLPAAEALEAASMHVDFDAVIIDAEASTVFISDPEVRLDVGAVAKGWATQRVAENAPSGLLISVGGNVCATGPKDAAGTPWVVGVQDPDDMGKNLHTLYISGGSVVTSGDYQRGYMVDGNWYHHIIDPVTRYPSDYWRSVTIICDDSGLADALSTALFLLPQEEGQQLLDQTGAMAMWVDKEGNLFYSPGFEDLIRT